MFRQFIRRLGPYPALVLLAVPTITVELLKLVAVFFLGDGQWATGLIVMLFAYAASLFITERLFRIVKPQLMILPWFRKIWVGFMSSRRKAFAYLGSKWVWTRNALTN